MPSFSERELPHKIILSTILIIVLPAVIYFLWQARTGNWEKGANPIMQIASTTPSIEAIETPARPTQKESGGAEVDTSSWLVYRNSQFDYEILYPAGSYVRDYGPNSIFVDIGNGAAPISIRVNTNPKFLSAKQWVEELKLKARSDPTVPLPVEQAFPKRGVQEGSVQVSGLEGYRLRVFAIDHEEDLYFLSTDRYVYEVGLTAFDPNDPNFNKHYPLFIRILTTFRLTQKR